MYFNKKNFIKAKSVKIKYNVFSTEYKGENRIY